MKNLITKAVLISTIFFNVFAFSSCKKFLDEVPNISLATPQSLADLQALLNNTLALNERNPHLHQVATDDLYYPSHVWNGITLERARDSYIWDPYVNVLIDWNNSYVAIGICNEVLFSAKNLVTSQNSEAFNVVTGTALFFRAYHLYQLAQMFAMPYGSGASGEQYGLPIPEEPNLERILSRRSVKETYDFIIKDIEDALPLLPAITNFKTQPNKTACNAFAARIYLNIGNFEKAKEYAKRTLMEYNTLIDFNKMDGTLIVPFQRFNNEVILHSTMFSLSALSAPTAKIDTVLYSSYEENDLRKSLFFVRNADFTYSFKGNYNGVASGALFNGLTTSEIYLIHAEASAQLNNLEEASEYINSLLSNRIEKSNFQPIFFTTQQEALRLIYAERRKEMLFRGQRWSDIRRFNKQTETVVNLQRVLNGNTYELKPDDKRYMFLIPEDVISFNPGMLQNPRD